jgi:alpha-glucosidase (family GH31 glycosyl hydrolase)
MMNYRLFCLACLLATGGCQCDPEPRPGTDAGTDVTDDAAVVDTSDARDLGTAAQCGDDGEAIADIGEWTLRLSYGDGSWSASKADDEPVIAGAAACDVPALRVFDGDPSVRAEFGNFQIDLEGDRVDTEWRAARLGVPRLTTSEDDVTLTYPVGDDVAALVFTAEDDDLRIRLDAPADGGELAMPCGAGESFFGLGTQVTGMDLRGGTYPLWTMEQGNSKPEGGGNFPLNNIPEAAYAPMGVWHSTRGYSALIGHDEYSEVDLCETNPDHVFLRSYRRLPELVVVTADTPTERMAEVTDYVGRVRGDIPDWVFGFWADAVTGPERLDEVADVLRAEEIPASAIWSEDWIGGESTNFGFRLSYAWEWDPATYPDLPTLTDDLHARGFAFLGYYNPFVPESVPHWQEGVDEGYLIEDADGELITFLDPAFRTASLIDLTDEAALGWLAEYQQTAVTEVGLDGWMADFAEWLPVDAQTEDDDGWAFHNRYPLAWQQANADNLAAAKEELGEPGNWVFFARSGWASANGGTAGIAPTLWGGDQNTDWGYDDGFPTIVPIGAHAGLAGVAIFGSDIAGYNSVGPIENSTKELWFRWASAAAFHPLMRTHHGGDECANWNFDRDQETLDHTRRWASIHALLLPEFRRLLTAATVVGLPISRHPWLVEPTRSGLWSGDQYQWFLGEDILVAPVLAEGETTRTVRLPGQGWWPLLGDAPITDATDADGEVVTTDVDAPVTETPAFVRPGRALVLLEEAVDSFYGAADAQVTDLTDVEGRYRVALYPDSDGAASSRSDMPFAVGGRDLAGFDPASATFGGTALSDCTGNPMESCIDGDTVLLIDVQTGTLEAGSATIDVDSPEPVTIRIGIAGTAWGELAEPTTYAPNPDAPTWCPENG